MAKREGGEGRGGGRASSGMCTGKCITVLAEKGYIYPTGVY